MNARVRKKLARRKHRIQKRLDKSDLRDCSKPMFTAARRQLHPDAYRRLGARGPARPELRLAAQQPLRRHAQRAGKDGVRPPAGRPLPQPPVAQPVTPDVASLQGHGFPPELLAAWAGSIPSLNQLQLDAMNQFGLLQGDHLVVSAPTSSGKTMVGELAALRGTLDRKRACFLFPLKALVNDKHRHFTRTHQDFGIRVIRATSEIADDIPALMRGQYDICLLTYEKFASLALAAPHLIEQLGTIVVDEMLDDEHFGGFVVVLAGGLDADLLALLPALRTKPLGFGQLVAARFVPQFGRRPAPTVRPIGLAARCFGGSSLGVVAGGGSGTSSSGGGNKSGWFGSAGFGA